LGSARRLCSVPGRRPRVVPRLGGGTRVRIGARVCCKTPPGRLELAAASRDDQGPPPWLERLFLVAIGLLFLINLVTAIGSAPSCWDALTYRLARVGYYLQHGTLDDYHANYWAQEQHGRLSALLFAGTLVLSGLSDRLIGLWQLAAWIVVMLEGYQLSRILGASAGGGRVAGASIGLFTIALMESTTAQNDLLITAFLGAGVIGIVGFLRHGGSLRLGYAAAAIAFAFGVKANALTFFPSLGLLGVLAAWHFSIESSRSVGRRLLQLGAATLLASVLCGAPAGYLKNWREHGNPLGGPEVLKHSNPEAGRVRAAALNATRYAFDFCTWDGLPESWAGSLGGKIKAHASAGLHRIGIDLEAPVSRRVPFDPARERHAHCDLAFFGVLGPLIVLPALLLCWLRREPLYVVALPFLLFFVAQSAAGRYDP
jgi:hypothetical protein